MSAARRRVGLVLAYLLSQGVLLLLLRMPDVPGEGSWLQAFRGYFSYDQLSYAAIATTTASGVGGLPEPFTETGTSYYPSLWYRILGWLAALTGQSIPTMWTLAGYALLAAMVLVVGFVAYRVSGRAWAPAVVGPALMIGTLSVVLHDWWYTTLDSHAVLWGPYGAIYVLNAEVAGFALVATALGLILWVTVGPARSTRARIAWLTVAAGLLGLVANMQTYSFLVGASVAFAWVAAYGLLRSRSRGLLIATAVLVVVAFVIGPRMTSGGGGLQVYGLLLLCTVPGIAWLARRGWRGMAIPALVFVLAALPQVAWVASGIASKDPFLTYRQVQSADLGVPVWAALLASLPVLSVWLFNLAVQRRSRNDVVLAALGGLAFAGTMLTFNNAWGFGQEPYRLWIDSVTISALLLAPITAWSISRMQDEPATRRFSAPFAVAATVIVALSLLDFGSFRSYVRDSGVIAFDGARYQAMATATASVDGLLSAGPCLDPKEVKIATRKPIAFYNLGLAWPANKDQIDVVLSNTGSGVLDVEAMRRAGIGYVMTDSACGTQWPMDTTMGVLSVGRSDYADAAGAGTITVWRIF